MNRVRLFTGAFVAVQVALVALCAAAVLLPDYIKSPTHPFYHHLLIALALGHALVGLWESREHFSKTPAQIHAAVSARTTRRVPRQAATPIAVLSLLVLVFW